MTRSGSGLAVSPLLYYSINSPYCYESGNWTLKSTCSLCWGIAAVAAFMESTSAVEVRFFPHPPRSPDSRPPPLSCNVRVFVSCIRNPSHH